MPGISCSSKLVAVVSFALLPRIIVVAGDSPVVTPVIKSQGAPPAAFVGAVIRSPVVAGTLFPDLVAIAVNRIFTR